MNFDVRIGNLDEEMFLWTYLPGRYFGADFVIDSIGNGTIISTVK